MKKEKKCMRTFDMGALRVNLPQKRGLSIYYSGKSRSYECIADVHCLDDLKKQEHPVLKKRKKQIGKRIMQHISPPLPCRTTSSSNPCTSPIVGL